MKTLFTLVTSTSNNLNKTFDEYGNKHSNAQLITGTYEVLSVDSVKHFLSFKDTIQSNQAVILGTPKDGSLSGTICSSSMKHDGAIHRTKDDFTFNGNHLLCFDYDPCEFGYKIESAEHYVEILRDIDPSLNDCEIGVTYGSSYGIKKDGEVLNNKLSLHAYISVENATDETVTQYKEWFLNEATKKGYSHIKISKSGSLLERTVCDMAIFSPERLLFEAPPTLASNISQNKPDDYIVGSGSRDLNDIGINDNSSIEIFKQLKSDKEDKAKIIREKFIDTKADELVISKGISKQKALDITKSRVENQTLVADDILYSKDGEITVKEILSNPDKYKDVSVLDPLNPKNGEYVAKIFVNDKSIIVHSFKNGGTNYQIAYKENNMEQVLKILTYLHHRDVAFDKGRYVRETIQSLKGDSSTVTHEESKAFKELLKTLKNISPSQNGKIKVPDNIEQYRYLQKHAIFSDDCKTFTVEEKTIDEFDSDESFALYQKAYDEYKRFYYVTEWEKKINSLDMNLLKNTEHDNITIHGSELENLKELIIDAPEVNNLLADGSYVINYNGTPRIYVTTPHQLQTAIENVHKIEGVELIFYQTFQGGLPY